MKNFRKNALYFVLPFIIGLTILTIINGCTSLTSTLHTKDKIDIKILKKGKSCIHNLFGGFKIPYFGETAIGLKGSKSIIVAIKKADISKPVIIDNYKKHWIFYSKECISVYGE